MKRAIALFCLALILLTACGPLPRPFGRDEGEPGNRLASQIFFEGVEVQPMTGTTKPMSELVADAIIDRLQHTYEIPASYRGMDRSEFVLMGHVVDNRTDPESARPVSIEWQLLRRDGEVVEKFVDAVESSEHFALAPAVKFKENAIVLAGVVVYVKKEFYIDKKGTWLA